MCNLEGENSIFLHFIYILKAKGKLLTGWKNWCKDLFDVEGLYKDKDFLVAGCCE